MHFMSSKSNGITFLDPQAQDTLKYITTVFVNDTTHWVNNFEQAIQGLYTTIDMYAETQKTAQWWEQLLYATGSKLELTKCSYYPIIWEFDEEGIPLLFFCF